jgi:hypothetical protein
VQPQEMNHRGYPPTPEIIRGRIAALSLLPADAEEWLPFMRDVIRMREWMLPAVQAAIQRNGWRTVAEPLEQIRYTAGKLGIEMKLNNGCKPVLEVTEESD